MKNYRERIDINPEVRFGKPCIRHSRISVYDVLGWLSSGMSMNDIIHDYPEISDKDIYACLAFAADREQHFKMVS